MSSFTEIKTFSVETFLPLKSMLTPCIPPCLYTTVTETLKACTSISPISVSFINFLQAVVGRICAYGRLQAVLVLYYKIIGKFE